MTDAAMRSTSATKSSSTSICACTDVEDEADAEDAETSGDTHIDIFPVIVDAALVGVIVLMQRIFGGLIPTAFWFFNHTKVYIYFNVYFFCLHFYNN